MAEIVIALQQPAHLTPELRTWIAHRLNTGRPVLTWDHAAGLDRGALLLRTEIDADGPDDAEDEVAELMTDLRLLGLRPSLVPQRPV